LQQKCVVQQEAANYIAAEVRRAVKKRRTTFMRTEGHGRQRKWRPPLRRLHLRCKVAALEARVRVLYSAT
jgi:hypothetical protein